jgi:hypothetical protein
MFSELILNLTKRLFPRGRAFRIAKDSDVERLNKGLIESENNAYTDALSVLSSILPDNAQFTATDAANWERRLGMLINEGADLEDRKEAILKKMQHPGNILGRSSWLNLERELQDAGFNVYVHENLLGVSPDGIIGTATLLTAVHRTGLQHGQTNHGKTYKEKTANNVNAREDQLFNVGSNYKSTFFIGGEVLGDFADVPATRETEFRQLILKIKPAQTIAYLFINYTI